MAKFSDAYYQLLELESVARKVARSLKMRRERSSPKEGEFALNAYYVGLVLRHLREGVASMAEESTTLDAADLSGMSGSELHEVLAGLDGVLEHLPERRPERGQAG